jgi:hypothetical protein
VSRCWLEPEALPEQSDDVPLPQANCSLMLAHPDDANAIAPFLKPKGSMIRIASPQRAFLACRLLDRKRERIKTRPRALMRFADPPHSWKPDCLKQSSSKRVQSWLRLATLQLRACLGCCHPRGRERNRGANSKPEWSRWEWPDMDVAQRVSKRTTSESNAES